MANLKQITAIGSGAGFPIELTTPLDADGNPIMVEITEPREEFVTKEEFYYGDYFSANTSSVNFHYHPDWGYILLTSSGSLGSQVYQTNNISSAFRMLPRPNSNSTYNSYAKAIFSENGKYMVITGTLLHWWVYTKDENGNIILLDQYPQFGSNNVSTPPTVLNGYWYVYVGNSVRRIPSNEDGLFDTSITISNWPEEVFSNLSSGVSGVISMDNNGGYLFAMGLGGWVYSTDGVNWTVVSGLNTTYGAINRVYHYDEALSAWYFGFANNSTHYLYQVSTPTSISGNLRTFATYNLISPRMLWDPEKSICLIYSGSTSNSGNFYINVYTNLPTLNVSHNLKTTLTLELENPTYAVNGVVANGYFNIMMSRYYTLTSVDGETWNMYAPRELTETLEFRSIATNGTDTIAVTWTGSILHTSDRVNWSEVYASGSNLSKVLWNETYQLFVAVGGNSVIYSTDTTGKTWRELSLGYDQGTTPIFNSGPLIAANDDLIMSVSPSAVFVSYNVGQNWIKVTSLSYNGVRNMNSIYHLGGQRFIMNFNDTTLAYTDDNGETWKKYTIGSTLPTTTIYATLAVLSYTDTTVTYVRFSTSNFAEPWLVPSNVKSNPYIGTLDLTTYTETVVHDMKHFGEIVNSQIYNGYHYDFTNGRAIIKSSVTDPTDLKIIFNPHDGGYVTPDRTRTQMVTPAYIGGLFRINPTTGTMVYMSFEQIGTGNNYTWTVYRSTDDGETWTEVVASTTIPTTLLGAVHLAVSEAEGDNRWVFSYSANTTQAGFRWSTDDGETWTAQQTLTLSSNIRPTSMFWEKNDNRFWLTAGTTLNNSATPSTTSPRYFFTNQNPGGIAWTEQSYTGTTNSPASIKTFARDPGGLTVFGSGTFSYTAGGLTGKPIIWTTQNGGFIDSTTRYYTGNQIAALVSNGSPSANYFGYAIADIKFIADRFYITFIYGGGSQTVGNISNTIVLAAERDFSSIEVYAVYNTLTPAANYIRYYDNNFNGGTINEVDGEPVITFPPGHHYYPLNIRKSNFLRVIMGTDALERGYSNENNKFCFIHRYKQGIIDLDNPKIINGIFQPDFTRDAYDTLPDTVTDPWLYVSNIGSGPGQDGTVNFTWGYVGTDALSYIISSPDYGATWEAIPTGDLLASFPNMVPVTIYRDGDHFMIYGGSRMAWVSFDKGQTWASSNDMSSNSSVNYFWWNSPNGEIWWVTSSNTNRLRSSSDGGLTWTPFYRAITSINDVIWDDTIGKWVFLIYHSSSSTITYPQSSLLSSDTIEPDDSWGYHDPPYPPTTGSLNQVTAYPGYVPGEMAYDNGKIYIITTISNLGRNIYSSTDLESWTLVSSNIPNANSGASSNYNRLFVRGENIIAFGGANVVTPGVTTLPMGYAQSLDGGQTWNTFLSDIRVTEIVETEEGYFMMGTDGYLSKSQDLITWTQQETGTTEAIYDYMIQGGDYVFLARGGLILVKFWNTVLEVVKVESRTWQPLDGDVALIKQNLISLFNYSIGQRFREENFGTRLMELIEEPNEQATAFLFKDYLKTAILAYEPRIKSLAVDITEQRFDQLKGKIRFKVNLDQNAEELDFTYNPQNNTANAN